MIKDFVYFFGGVVILFIILNSYQQIKGDMVYVKLKNGRTFLVRNIVEKGKDKEKAAKLLDTVLDNLLLIKKEMETNKKYKDHPAVKRLTNNFKASSITESLPESEYTSYSLNKGEKISMCIRHKKDTGTNKRDDFIAPNTIMFVAIHEMAHVMTKSIGHKDDFWHNMKILLCIAQEKNIYTREDYKQTNKPYCGTEITSTPLKCTNSNNKFHCDLCDDEIKKWLKDPI